MWEDIFRQNRENLLEAIDAFQKELEFCKSMIEDKNWDDLYNWMKDANSLHDIL